MFIVLSCSPLSWSVSRRPNHRYMAPTLRYQPRNSGSGSGSNGRLLPHATHTIVLQSHTIYTEIVRKIIRKAIFFSGAIEVKIDIWQESLLKH